MRVGIVCEGKTDFVVLKAIAEAVLANMRPTCALLQPDHDRVRRPGEPRSAGGWQAVRSFLKAGGARVSIDLGKIDIVIVHIDASVRHLGEVVPELADDELETLCDHVKSWIGEQVPESLVITLPREEIETWLVAAHTRRKHVESLADPAEILVIEGLIGARSGRPNKNTHDYVMLSQGLSSRVGDRKLLGSIPELERLCSKLRARARRRER